MTEINNLFDGNAALKQCPQCGYVLPRPGNDDLSAAALYHPWHVRDQAALMAYVGTLADEAREWLLALFVDDQLNLLSVETMARGGVSECKVDVGEIYLRGRAVRATGFFLVHNHPSGDPTPSRADILVTNRLRRLSAELDLPLIEHVIVARDGMRGVGSEA